MLSANFGRDLAAIIIACVRPGGVTRLREIAECGRTVSPYDSSTCVADASHGKFAVALIFLRPGLIFNSRPMGAFVARSLSVKLLIIENDGRNKRSGRRALIISRLIPNRTLDNVAPQ